MKTIAAFLAVLFLTHAATAQNAPAAAPAAPAAAAVKPVELSPGHRAEIEKMLVVLKTGENYERSMLAGFEASVGLDSDRFQQLPPDQRAKVVSAVGKAKKYMLTEMGWPKVKDSIVALYGRTFSEPEARAINKLIDNETGRLLVSRQLTILPDLMRVGQAKSQEMMPGLMKLLQEEMGAKEQ